MMTTETKLAYFDGRYGYLAFIDPLHDAVAEIETTAARPGRYVRIDDSRNYPQICEGGSSRGITLEWDGNEARMGPTFARDCGARLYKTREGYERAKKRLAEVNT